MFEGKDKLLTWFSLSYASWLTLPRVLMEDMPDEWQSKMADLLNEYDERFPNQPELGTRVQITGDNGRLVKTPHELINYRRPDKNFINSLKAKH